MSLYFCDGCLDQIPPDRPRFHCQQCPSYDICAHCIAVRIIAKKLTGDPAKGHDNGHHSQLILKSGFGRQLGRPSTGVSAWTDFFHPGTWAATPCFVELTTAIFDSFDIAMTGLMVPEAYSALSEITGGQSPWTQALQAAVGPNPKQQADTALKRAYDIFTSIEYVVRPRLAENMAPEQTWLTPAASNISVEEKAPDSAPPNQMPCLTKVGFTELSRLEALSSPDTAWREFNTILRFKEPRIYLERREIPRHVLPSGPTPEMVAPFAAAVRNAQMRER
ncbi:hypothetical protein CONLIGDRAFT_710806 [Coniochaeta ligniaria NRRL 30616]|uniref:ZZ-type domain-containing protein n=1 Tax=Coniochaeta ligniaria NRRL 30616 TaxID=1408157 RepID=A0A1J7JQI4_9PEZI|nr:hypothetical protein CONLIGDRAFT_710806 [Coniochaeta ligniaria NRRL 30616]